MTPRPPTQAQERPPERWIAAGMTPRPPTERERRTRRRLAALEPLEERRERERRDLEAIAKARRAGGDSSAARPVRSRCQSLTVREGMVTAARTDADGSTETLVPGRTRFAPEPS
jgi:hypothetical protein